MQTPKKTRFTVAFNGDDSLIPALARFPEVDSIFGKMSQDVVGGGRPTAVLADVGLTQLKKSVQLAHQHNISFNYLLNSVCMGNQEFSRKTNKQIHELLDTIVDAGVDGAVVATPYFLALIKRRYPKLKVSISTFACVNSPRAARSWEDGGADRLILATDISRNRRMLETIRKAVKCELEVFANVMCNYKCAFGYAHTTTLGHASSSGDPLQGFAVEHHVYRCTERRLRDPSEFVRGRFVRPEDMGVYEDMGIDVFKISDRLKGTPWILRAVAAYAARHYEGNLADIIAYPVFHAADERPLIDPTRFLARSKHVSLALLQATKGISDCVTPVHIDNRKLDGFLDHYFRHDCDHSLCGRDCHYCESVAKRAVTMLPDRHDKCLTHLEEISAVLEDGRAFGSDGPIARLGMLVVRAFSPRKADFGNTPSKPG